MFTAMIVDDEKWVRTALRHTIETSEMPLTVLMECSDGQEALTWLEHDQVDLVFADIRMPSMDGLTLVKKLREQGNRQDVVLITVYNDFEFAQEALRLGVVDYLLKPVQAEDISACVQKWLKRKEPLELLTAMPKRPEVIEKVLEFIAITPLSAVSLTAASHYVHLTPSYLSGLFKQHMAITFVEYLTEVRMREAKKLLRNTTLPVAEIAARLAYSDVAYFSNSFKREASLSPSEYRNRYASGSTLEEK